MKEFVGKQIINCFETVLLGFCVNPDKILNTRLKCLVLQKGDLRMAKCSCVNVFWDWDLCLFLGQKLLSDPLWIKKKNNSYCNRNENLGSYAIWDWKLPQWKGGSIVILSSRAGSGGRCTGGEASSSDTDQGTSDPPWLRGCWHSHCGMCSPITSEWMPHCAACSGSFSMMVMVRFGWTWYKPTVFVGFFPLCFKFSSPPWKCPDFKKSCGAERSQLLSPK